MLRMLSTFLHWYTPGEQRGCESALWNSLRLPCSSHPLWSQPLPRNWHAQFVNHWCGPFLGSGLCSRPVAHSSSFALFYMIMVMAILQLGNCLWSYLIDLPEGGLLDARIIQISFQLYKSRKKIVWQIEWNIIVRNILRIHFLSFCFILHAVCHQLIWDWEQHWAWEMKQIC